MIGYLADAGGSGLSGFTIAEVGYLSYRIYFKHRFLVNRYFWTFSYDRLFGGCWWVGSFGIYHS